MKKFLSISVLLILFVAVLASCKTVTYDTELITNGNFEDVTGSVVNGWTKGKEDDAYSKIQIVDDFSPRGNVISISHTSKKDYSYYYQEVTVQRNAYYKLSAYIHTKTLTESATNQIASPGAFIGFVESDDFVYSSVVSTNGAWSYVEIYFYTKGYSKLKVALRLGTEANPVTAAETDVGLRFDDVSLKKISQKNIPDAIVEGKLIRSLTKSSVNYASGLSVFITVFAAVLSAALCFTLYYFIRKGLKEKDTGAKTKLKISSVYLLVIVLAAGFLIRLLMQRVIAGYDEKTGPYFYSDLLDALTDGFSGWAQIFNTTTGKSQTPGMLFVYSIIGGLCKLFGIDYGEAGIDLMAKIPGIIADLLAAGYIFIFARRFTGERTAFLFALVYAVLPSVFIASSGWGTADSILGLFLIFTFFSVLDKKYILACVYMTLALIFNVKALYVLPLVTAFLIYTCYRRPEARTKIIITAVACLVGFWVISFPFTDFTVNPFYIFVQYTRLSKVTIGGTLLPIIDRTSLDAFNFYTMIGGNNSTYSNVQAVFDIIIAVCLFAGTISLYFKKKNRVDLILLSAFMIVTIYIFTLGMQPFSMIFGLVLLLLYVIVSNEKRVLFLFSAYSLTTVLNIMMVLSADGLVGGSAMFKANTTATYYSLLGTAGVIIMSVINVLLTLYFAYLVYDITYKGNLKSILPLGDNSGDNYITTKVKGLLFKK
ncbi:MAG: hypothetical protein LBT30_08280 [Clostridiales bacterium]|jgi:Gpi18-like mannosyltransferase|nr:hypothetical protein [Clostridiales bacterium]